MRDLPTVAADDRHLTVVMEPWRGPWDPDDPNANFKREMAIYAEQDPLTTIRPLSESMDIPIGAIARYVLARFATTGSGGLLELGPSMILRLLEPVERAEMAGTDEARLAAYDQVREMLEWLRLPLDGDAGYGRPPSRGTSVPPSESVSP